jgi:hypothetical protein
MPAMASAPRRIWSSQARTERGRCVAARALGRHARHPRARRIPERNVLTIQPCGTSKIRLDLSAGTVPARTRGRPGPPGTGDRPLLAGRTRLVVVLFAQTNEHVAVATRYSRGMSVWSGAAVRHAARGQGGRRRRGKSAGHQPTSVRDPQAARPLVRARRGGQPARPRRAG